MMTSSPFFQSAPVATWYLSVSWSESIDAENLLEVAPRARRIGDHQANFLVVIDHKNRADRQRVVPLGMDHVVELRDFLVRIAEDREIQLDVLRFLDVA